MKTPSPETNFPAAQHHLGKPPERLALTDLDAPLILAFLNHLERERHNTIRSRNARLRRSARSCTSRPSTPARARPLEQRRTSSAHQEQVNHRDLTAGTSVPIK